MIKVECSVPIYEVDAKEVAAVGGIPMKVLSHWTRYNCVVLVLPSGDSITVFGRDLLAAVHNAMNTKT